MKITKIYEPGDAFVVLHVECPPGKTFTRSISTQALVDGVITLKDEIASAQADAEAEIAKHEAILQMLEEE